MHYNENTVIETKPVVLKSEIVRFCNSTKCGVDKADQMCNTYDVSRIFNRWSLRILFHKLNTAGINIFALNYSVLQDIKIPHSKFIDEIGFSLIHPHMDERAQIPKINYSLKISLNPKFRNHESYK